MASSGKIVVRPIDPQVRMGHVHLKVADLERAIGFYRDVLGFELMQRIGDQAAFLSAGGYHHHIALNTWESLGGPPPPDGTTGLYHHAIVYPNRAALADALRRLIAAGIGLEGAADHGVSESLYLRDPDGNGVELYCDRPQQVWPRTADGRLAMYTRHLDLRELLGELNASPTEIPTTRDLQRLAWSACVFVRACEASIRALFSQLSARAQSSAANREKPDAVPARFSDELPGAFRDLCSLRDAPAAWFRPPAFCCRPHHGMSRSDR